MELIIQLWKVLSGRRKLQLFLSAGFLIIIGLLEIITLSLFGALLQILINPESSNTGLLFIITESLKKHCFFISSPSVTELVKVLSFTFSVAVLTAGLMRVFVTWVNCRLTAALGTDITTQVFEKSLNQDYEQYIKYRAGELMSLVKDKASEVAGVIFYLLTLVTSLIIGILIISGLVILDPLFYLGTVAILGAFYTLCAFSAKKRMKQNSQINSEGTTRITKAIQEAFGGFRDIILDDSAKFYTKVYREAELKTRQANTENLFLSTSPRYLTETVAMVAFAGILWWGIVWTENFHDTLPRLGVLALGAQRLMPLVQQGYMSWAILAGSTAATQIVLKVLSKPQTKFSQRASNKLLFKKQIFFKSVDYRYPETNQWVLQGLTLKIKKGDRVGIVGSTGAGKSTLADLVMGLLHPTNGEILVDGRVLTKERMPDWRKNIAHVPQDIFLIDASYAENIALGTSREDINLNKVKKVAKKSQISSFIESRPKKYWEEIGERGRNLSGGQRQRIAIARALYKDANILIFDEATSALDGVTEDAVMRSINKIGRKYTLLIISHRNSTLRNCNKIINLNNLKKIV